MTLKKDDEDTKGCLSFFAIVAACIAIGYIYDAGYGWGMFAIVLFVCWLLVG